MSWGAASEVVPKFVSPSDPAAQWTGAHKGAAFFASSDNYLVDMKFGVIVDLEASRAIRQAEAQQTDHGRADRGALRSQARTAYRRYRVGAAPMLNWLVEKKGHPPRYSCIR